MTKTNVIVAFAAGFIDYGEMLRILEDWNEADHPRVGKGDPEGGQFTAGGGSSGEGEVLKKMESTLLNTEIGNGATWLLPDGSSKTATDVEDDDKAMHSYTVDMLFPGKFSQADKIKGKDISSLMHQTGVVRVNYTYEDTALSAAFVGKPTESQIRALVKTSRTDRTPLFLDQWSKDADVLKSKKFDHPTVDQVKEWIYGS